MAYDRKPVPPEAELIALAMSVREVQPQIDRLLGDLERLYDVRAVAIKAMYDHGLRYIDIQRLLPINGGSIAAALNRARRLATVPAVQPADLVNSRTNEHGA